MDAASSRGSSSGAASSQLDSLSFALLTSSTPLDARFRALFTLKGLASAQSSLVGAVIEIIGKGFADDSALLKHELAYCLGQIADLRAVSTLESVVRDDKQDIMVRHEAAEALGAISSWQSLPLLKEYAQRPGEDISVVETCELAIHKIEWDHSDEGKKQRAEEAERKKQATEAGAGGHEAFAPIDPAPPLAAKASLSSGQKDAAASSLSSLDPAVYDIVSLRSILTNRDLPLFERYRAMFSLRNAVHACLRASEQTHVREIPPQQARAESRLLRQKAEQAVLALAAGLEKGEKSALFRHEICFVFGELCHRASIKSMLQVLNDSEEHEMVRHEAAEALGGIAEEVGEDEDGEAASAEPGEDELKSVMHALKRWANDATAPRVVRESCVVALDEMAYNNDPSQFQPMDSAPVATAA
ncbi:ARM repeat-containing protein [Tilletiaria anomala UBC 951]|uniref:Deoxyhypusine hydroxylase n=1 Tax=Tilletiaria anomala (strain ATCC 24038 / CBS 436.72 / UBC 951) TaxID=1037660 RepID=A0A066VUQ5_TILAU|nr:ARM repeat-containing protein [Tilletiaria anomala UBC 951]KDN45442.1 ARM repeat-containing protein [Tilletiaria anomala UBC 951]